MKRLCFLLALILLSVSVFSCGGGDVTTKNDTTTKKEPDITTKEPVKSISTVEEMTELDGVSSVTKNEEYSTNGCLVYDISFNLDGVLIDAQMALPDDYSTKNYATVLYFPDVRLIYQYLTEVYASNGFIIIRFGTRSGADETQRRDFCGKDYEDVKSFFEICKQCNFLTRGGVSVIGSAEGSVRALKLARDYPDDIMGCAVIDVISDIESFIEFRGEGIKQLFEYQIGYSIEEKPEEYRERSAVYFADEISVPVLIFAYNNSPIVPMSQATMLKDALLDGGGSCQLNIIDTLSADFMTQDSIYALISWIQELNASRF